MEDKMSLKINKRIIEVFEKPSHVEWVMIRVVNFPYY